MKTRFRGKKSIVVWINFKKSFLSGYGLSASPISLWHLDQRPWAQHFQKITIFMIFFLSFRSYLDDFRKLSFNKGQEILFYRISLIFFRKLKLKYPLAIKILKRWKGQFKAQLLSPKRKENKRKKSRKKILRCII